MRGERALQPTRQFWKAWKFIIAPVSDSGEKCNASLQNGSMQIENACCHFTPWKQSQSRFGWGRGQEGFTPLHAEWTLQSYVKSQTSTVRVQYTVYGAVVSAAASLQEGCGFNAQRSLHALSVSPWLSSSSAAFLSAGQVLTESDCMEAPQCSAEET